MRPFDFVQPASLEEVFDALDRYGEDAHLVAGGTALLQLMKQGLLQPAVVVSLRQLPGLDGIARTPDGGLQIGGLVTHRQAELSPLVRAFDPTLAAVFGHVATVRIRHQGTLGGNLVHADPAQDPPPLLLALDGTVTLASKHGERTVPLDGFFVDYFETALQPGEVLTQVRLPAQPAGLKTHYVKFLPRTADDYATVAVAAALQVGADHRVQAVRLVLGAAGATPIRAREAEAALQGQALTPALLREAGALARAVADPADDTRGSADYKKDMVAVWVRRALERLADGGRPNGRGH